MLRTPLLQQLAAFGGKPGGARVSPALILPAQPNDLRGKLLDRQQFVFGQACEIELHAEFSDPDRDPACP